MTTDSPRTAPSPTVPFAILDAWRALFVPAVIASPEAIDVLLDQGVPVDLALDDGLTALATVLKTRTVDWPVVQHLVRREADLDVTVTGMTNHRTNGPKAWARIARGAQPEVLAALLDRGVDVHRTTAENSSKTLTALDLVVQGWRDQGLGHRPDWRQPVPAEAEHRVVRCLTLLEDRGMNLGLGYGPDEQILRQGMPPLVEAMKQGMFQVADILLARAGGAPRAHVPFRWMSGTQGMVHDRGTVLHWAAGLGHADAVQWALGLGLDPRTVSLKGRTALQVARDRTAQEPALITMLERLELHEVARSVGVDAHVSPRAVRPRL